MVELANSMRHFTKISEYYAVLHLCSSYFKTGISEKKGPKVVNDDYTRR
jgi:hypothetical protein